MDKMALKQSNGIRASFADTNQGKICSGLTALHESLIVSRLVARAGARNLGFLSLPVAKEEGTNSGW